MILLALKQSLVWNDFAETAWPSLLAQWITLAYASLIPDAGQSLEVVLAVTAGYWLMTHRLWRARNTATLTAGDLYFIRHGYLALVPLAAMAALFGEQLRALY